MMRGIRLLLLVVAGSAVLLGPQAHAQSVKNITWTPVSPSAGEPVTFQVHVTNPGPEAPICIKLETPGGNPQIQTHPGIGIRSQPPLVVAFDSAVTYGAAGVYKLKALLRNNDCVARPLKAARPFREEHIRVKAAK